MYGSGRPAVAACGWPSSGIVLFPSLLHTYHMAQSLHCILSMAFGVKLVDGAPGCMVMIMLIMPRQIRTSFKARRVVVRARMMWLLPYRPFFLADLALANYLRLILTCFRLLPQVEFVYRIL